MSTLFTNVLEASVVYPLLPQLFTLCKVSVVYYCSGKSALCSCLLNVNFGKSQLFTLCSRLQLESLSCLLFVAVCKFKSLSCLLFGT